MSPNRASTPVLLLVGAALATLLVHLVVVPRHVPSNPLRGIPALVAGWATFALAFYALGRLASQPDDLPSMRAADAGLALFFLAAIGGIVLDSLGADLGSAAEAYALPAAGLYAGLALVGWAIGRRTKAINRIANEE